MATIAELSRQYRLECARLKMALQKQKAEIPMDGRTWYDIEIRQKTLNKMIRELRELSQYLEHYYDGEARNYYYNMSNISARNYKE